jgi:hypothetical protein
VDEAARRMIGMLRARQLALVEHASEQLHSVNWAICA